MAVNGGWRCTNCWAGYFETPRDHVIGVAVSLGRSHSEVVCIPQVAINPLLEVPMMNNLIGLSGPTRNQHCTSSTRSGGVGLGVSNRSTASSQREGGWVSCSSRVCVCRHGIRDTPD